MQLLKCWVGPLIPGSLSAVLPVTPAPTANHFLLSTPVILDNPRRLYVTFQVGEPTTSYLLIQGTGWGNAPIVDVVYAPASGTTSISALDFKTVTKILSGTTAFTGTVEVGTGATASSQWLRFDDYMQIQAFGQINKYGTVNYTVETTMEDPTEYWLQNTPPAQTPIQWFPSMAANVVGATTSQQFLFHVPSFLRLTLNSSGNTAADYAVGYFTQHNSSPI